MQARFSVNLRRLLGFAAEIVMKGAIVMTSRSGPFKFVTAEEFCDEVRISRSTFDAWHAKGILPPVTTLPNRKLRLARSDVDDWIAAHTKGAA